MCDVHYQFSILCKNKKYGVICVIRSLLLDKSTEIMQLKQENNVYKQKYTQAIEEKDKEVSGMLIIRMRYKIIRV